MVVSQPRMHDDEVDTDVDLVRRLLASQFPQWAELPIARVASAGTDNAIYRLGDDLAVRLPRIHWAVDNVAKEPEKDTQLQYALSFLRGTIKDAKTAGATIESTQPGGDAAKDAKDKAKN